MAVWLSVAGGWLLVLAAVVLTAWHGEVRGRPVYDRPRATWSPWFRLGAGAAKAALLVAGVVLLARAGWGWALAGFVVVALLATRRAYVSSERYQVRVARAQVEELRRRLGPVSERELLVELVRRRHPRWEDELVEQMVEDYPEPDALARMLTRISRQQLG